MSRSDVSAISIVYRALRLIQAYGIQDSEPDPNYVAEALEWLGIHLDGLAGRAEILSFETAEYNLALKSGVQTYRLAPGPVVPKKEITADLETITADGSAVLNQVDQSQYVPNSGHMHPKQFWLLDGDNDRGLIPSIYPRDWNAIDDRSKSGQPVCAFVRHHAVETPTINFWPIPDNNDYTVRVLAQSYVPSFEAKKHDSFPLHSYWQEWAIYRLAESLGGGAINEHPQNRLNYWTEKADNAERQIISHAEKHYTSLPRQVAFVDF